MCAAVIALATSPISAMAEAQHTLGPSYQLTVINSKQGNQSVLEAPGLTYALTVGGTWGFQGTFTGFFPVSAYQNGTHFTVSDIYGSAWGLDAVLAAFRRLCLGPGLEIDLGLGPHLNGVSMKGLRGQTNYSDFNSFTLGVGLSAVVRWRPGSGPLSLGAFGSGAVDFVDLLHGGDLSVGFGVTAGALIGVDLL